MIDFSLVSKFRAQLMGLAAIFIILCHTSLYFEGNVQTIYSIYICQLMQSGVDIFLLLSGLGCYYSYRKNPSVKTFYKKRLIRIAVPFFIFLLIYFIIDCLLLHHSIFKFLKSYSVISFYTSGNLTVWFVAAILLLYVLFPLFYKLINKNIVVYFICIAAITVLVLLPIWNGLPKPLPRIREIFLCRIPVFLLGTWMGKSAFEKKSTSTNNKCTIVLIGLFLLSLIAFSLNAYFNTFDQWTYSRLLFIPFVFSLVILLSSLFQKFEMKNKTLVFFGALSFELYLVFERVLELVSQYMPQPQIIYSHLSKTVVQIIFNLIAIGCTVLIALIINRISKKISNLLLSLK